MDLARSIADLNRFMALATADASGKAVGLARLVRAEGYRELFSLLAELGTTA